MAGHSKFKNIQFRKGAQDKKRSKLFSKLAREITAAAKMGMSDPAMNARLRTAVVTARAQNMPKDNIERAIKKSQEAGGANYEEVRYEGFGAGGVGHAHLGRRGDLAGELGEQLGALLVLRPFAELDVLEFRMAGHRPASYWLAAL